MEKEVWKDIPGFEGLYKISNFGNVFSIFKNELKVLDNSRSYLQTSLFKKGKMTKIRIHRMVAELFCEKKPGMNVTNHLDGNKHNNYYKNLEWTDYKGNAQHSWKKGLSKAITGEDCSYSKLTEKQIYEIIKLVNKNVSQSKISKKFNITRSMISLIVRNKRWKHLTKTIDYDTINKPNSKTKIIDQFGKIYNSLTDCAKELNLSIGNISMVLHGIRKHTKGYKFTFLKEKL